MTGREQCSTCGGPLEPGVLAGRCPRCLVELAIGSTAGHSAGAPAENGRSPQPVLSAAIGRYKLLRLIGEGAMGLVYEAEQEHPRRTVALKIIKAGLTNTDLLRRFEQEYEALGRLQHPGIAQIYEAGTADTGFGPQPYFAMELIRGRSPRDHVRDGHLTTRQRLELIAKIADAVHHAHQRGLIHRDLKPSNIVVDESGQPKVLDFGLTLVTDDVESSRKTDAGQVLGTLAYMSPEQVSGDPLEVDVRTDVYALGVLFHELLAERPPYETGKKLHEAIRAIQEDEPLRLSTIDRTFGGDIETIARKALEKNKTRRYTSAAEFAADIRRYLRDEPIIARPPSIGYQLQKFSRRHRGLVAAVGAVFVALVLGVVASTWQATRALRAERVAVLERDRARQAETTARTERDRAAGAEQQATIERDRALVAETRATEDRNRALAAEHQARLQRDAAVTEKGRADAEAAAAREQHLLNVWRSLSRESVRDSSNRLDGDRAALLARQALLLHALTPQEPRYLVEDAIQQAAAADRWSHAVPRGARTVAFSPDRTHMAGGGVDALVRVWNVRQPGAPRYLFRGHGAPVNSVAFSADGTRLASASDGIRVWDLRTPDAPPIVLGAGGKPVTSVTFSPDGTRLAAGGEIVRIWDLQSPGAQPLQLAAGQAEVRSVAFSADGAFLAAGGDRARLWNLRDLNTGPLVLGDKGISAVAFSADGRLATGGADAFSPDGRLTTGDNVIRIWIVSNTSAPPLQLGGTSLSSVSSLAFSPDDTRLVAGSLDGNLRIWNLEALNAEPTVLRGQRNITSVTFSTDGSNLASADYDTLWLWDLDAARIPRTVLRRLAAESAAAVSANGQRAAFMAGRSVSIWNLEIPAATPITIPNAGLGPFTVLSNDGRYLASADAANRVRVWDVNRPEEPPLVLEGHTGGILSIGFFPDGSRLATGSLDRTVRVWNINGNHTPPLVLRFEGPQGMRALAFSPDGSKLAFNSIDRVYLVDLRSPNPTPVLLKAVMRLGTITTALAFSPDGSRLATGDGVSQTVRVIDLRAPDRAPLILQGGHKDVVRSVIFSPDGWLLASTSQDATIRMWDLRRAEALPLVFRVPAGPASAAVFLGDGSRVRALTRTAVVEWPLWSTAADYLCSRVWRNLSLNEWRQYVGDLLPYQQTCPGLPPGEEEAESDPRRDAYRQYVDTLAK